MKGILADKKIAILATDGFEQSELLKPKAALEKAGAEVKIVSLKRGKIKGWDKKNWGQEVAVDALVEKLSAKDFDALVLPGGVMNPDTLRMEKKAVDFIKGFFDAGKLVAAICHAPWTLINAGATQGRKLTSWASLQKDLENAGATWVDKEVVFDKNLITSRKPQDIPAFNQKIIDELGKKKKR